MDNYAYLCGKFKSKPMATTGYIFLSKKYDTLDEDRKWMIDYGCDCIIEENGRRRSSVRNGRKCGQLLCQ